MSFTKRGTSLFSYKSDTFSFECFAPEIDGFKIEEKCNSEITYKTPLFFSYLSTNTDEQH